MKNDKRLLFYTWPIYFLCKLGPALKDTHPCCQGWSLIHESTITSYLPGETTAPPHIILFWFVSRQNEMRNTSWRFSAPRQHGDAWNIKHNRQQEYITQRKHDGQNITNVNNQIHIVTYSYNSFHFRHFKSSTFILFLEMHKIIMQSPTFSANQMNVK